MSTYRQQIKIPSATAGHLPPVSGAGAATVGPGTGGWLSGALLLGRSLLMKLQTGAFSVVTTVTFRLAVANDANGTGAAAVAGTDVIVGAANTAAHSSFDTIGIDPTKFYAIQCVIGAGAGTALVAGTLSLLDADYAP